MTSRERMLTALSNGRPDRLPCQVHDWMTYFLKTYLDGRDRWEAFKMFDLDFAIYVSPTPVYCDSSLSNWLVDTRQFDVDASGNHLWTSKIRTPKGELSTSGAYNEFTSWDTEPIIKSERDFALWDEYYPVPVSVDLTTVSEVYDQLGDRGIVRSHPFSPGQGSPWQSFCFMYGTQESIMLGLDEPDVLHHYLEQIVQKTLNVTRLWEGTKADMVEVGGGAGSSTVISPRFYKEFGLPYDRRQNAAFHELGLKVVNHFCGGLMPMLELVVESGADGLETMTPADMGGDCNLAEASRRVGDRLFFIGGFDQNLGFWTGTPETARQIVLECFEATKQHAGYICCPSDHFFDGKVENIRAFAQACRECAY